MVAMTKKKKKKKEKMCYIIQKVVVKGNWFHIKLWCTRELVMHKCTKNSPGVRYGSTIYDWIKSDDNNNDDIGWMITLVK